jgi:hypothetical protein
MKLSAQNGYPGGMYGYGIGMVRHDAPNDRREGIYWLRKAQASGDSRTAELATWELEALGER